MSLNIKNQRYKLNYSLLRDQGIINLSSFMLIYLSKYRHN
ncbi:hypothetical protein GNIT_0992 [Glaciecola nitratireducens FR1064]|uniref:Uncharacterized protein n=1 Tax=Glaciecola nitratireducens (strain JCM 12485 / KCTC 12276 / FR1064) TaxID=1085623 RepID=G4QK07_GLANF|nr:hypothetical protein GNIT_0992 [Glaciecola nitratireducens FR1064]